MTDVGSNNGKRKSAVPKNNSRNSDENESQPKENYESV
jgi:hypothetical protein